MFAKSSARGFQFRPMIVYEPFKPREHISRTGTVSTASRQARYARHADPGFCYAISRPSLLLSAGGLPKYSYYREDYSTPLGTEYNKKVYFSAKIRRFLQCPRRFSPKAQSHLVSDFHSWVRWRGLPCISSKRRLDAALHIAVRAGCWLAGDNDIVCR